MRMSVFASVLCALALAGVVASPGPATAAKSKMGCEIGSEVWNAGTGKCEPGASKWKRAPEKSAAAAPAPKKAAAKKKAPAKK
jgi:hypothetical protein